MIRSGRQGSLSYLSKHWFIRMLQSIAAIAMEAGGPVQLQLWVIEQEALCAFKLCATILSVVPQCRVVPQTEAPHPIELFQSSDGPCRALLLQAHIGRVVLLSLFALGVSASEE